MTYAYCTLEEVKTYLGIQTNRDDTLLERLILTASQRINDYCSRVFSVSSVSSKYYSSASSFVEKYSIVPPFDLCYLESLVVGETDYTPILRLITNNDGLIYAIEIPESHRGDYIFTGVDDNIVITGYWSYSEEPPQAISQATQMLAMYYYRLKDRDSVGDLVALPDGSGYKRANFGIPSDVVDILYGYRKRVHYDIYI